MIFNKNNNGAEELQQLTGNYYANNQFERIQTDISLETENLIKIIGQPVYSRAEAFYKTDRFNGTEQTDEEKLNQKLVEHIQLPVALMAAYRYYQSNIISHEDSGRKIKIDNDNEKLPWEWMFDRDDQANLRKAYQCLDRLIAFLDNGEFAEWKDSEAQKATRQLFINNTQAFQDVYPIDNSHRFYYTVLPFISEVQRINVMRSLGSEKYLDLHAKFVAGTVETEADQKLLELVKRYIPLQTMVIAVKRLSLQVLPEGVVQQFKSMLQGRSSSQPALMETVKLFRLDLEKDAEAAMTDIKDFLNSADPESLIYPLLPDNTKCNKIFRT